VPLPLSLPNAGRGATVIAEFITRYNHEWLIERLEYRTPAEARAEGWRAAA
jgi:hypothetical protein